MAPYNFISHIEICLLLVRTQNRRWRVPLKPSLFKCLAYFITIFCTIRNYCQLCVKLFTLMLRRLLRIR